MPLSRSIVATGDCRPSSRMGHRPLGLLVAIFVVAISTLALPGSAHAAGTPIMGRSQLEPADLAGWYASMGKTPNSALGISVADLARLFVEEGAAEGVRGDIAFAQTMVETGYLSFPSYGQVRPQDHNYAGIGAPDGGSRGAIFPDPRTGVRAQIQHLRAYADKYVTQASLAHPVVDPRFAFVSKGCAPSWDALSGRWATATSYGSTILSVYGRMSSWKGARSPIGPRDERAYRLAARQRWRWP